MPGAAPRQTKRREERHDGDDDDAPPVFRGSFDAAAPPRKPRVSKRRDAAELPPLADLPPLPPLEAIGAEWAMPQQRGSGAQPADVRVSGADADLFADLGGGGGSRWADEFDDGDDDK